MINQGLWKCKKKKSDLKIIAIGVTSNRIHTHMHAHTLTHTHNAWKGKRNRKGNLKYVEEKIPNMLGKCENTSNNISTNIKKKNG